MEEAIQLKHLQQENNRLLQEVEDLKRAYDHLEHSLTKSYYQNHKLREQLQNRVSMGSVLTFLGVLVAAVLLFYYGIGSIDFSGPSVIDNYSPVVERQQ